METGAITDRIQAGWAALATGAWTEARALFEVALAEAETAEACEGLSWAAWWLNDAPAVFDARERAYRLYRSRGDVSGAARIATWLGNDHVDFRGEPAVAQGWFARARRLLQGTEPGLEHGWLCIHEADKRLAANDTRRVRELGKRASELGRRLGDVDLEMMGLATEGIALVTDGRVEDGMSRLDEASAAALSGEFREIWATVWCCCYMLYACERVRDYDRAAQWCRRVEEWSARMGIQFLNRVCRAHYAGVLIWRGTWAKAEKELADAAAHLGVIRPPMAAEAVVRLGELRRRQGLVDEAVAIFEQVADHPLALLGSGEILLDRGDAPGARDLARQYLRDAPPHTGPLRAAGLELLVRALSALGETDTAVAALEELHAIADQVPTDPLRGSASFAEGFWPGRPRSTSVPEPRSRTRGGCSTAAARRSRRPQLAPSSPLCWRNSRVPGTDCARRAPRQPCSTGSVRRARPRGRTRWRRGCYATSNPAPRRSLHANAKFCVWLRTAAATRPSPKPSC